MNNNEKNNSNNSDVITNNAHNVNDSKEVINKMVQQNDIDCLYEDIYSEHENHDKVEKNISELEKNTNQDMFDNSNVSQGNNYMQNISARLRNLEEKSYNTVSENNNQVKQTNNEVLKNIGKYLLSGNKSHISKTIGVVDENRQAISISTKYINSDVFITRLIDSLNKVHLKFGESLNICNFFTDNKKNAQGAKVFSNTYDDLTKEIYHINDPLVNVQSCKPITLNYYTSVLQSLYANNIEESVTKNIIYQIYKKENDLIINGTEKEHGFTGLNAFFNNEKNHKNVKINEFKDQALENIVDLISSVANHGDREFWMTASTFAYLAGIMNLNYHNKLDINSIQLLGFPINIVNIPKIEDQEKDHRIWFGNFKTINVGVSDIQLSTTLNNRQSAYDISGTETFTMTAQIGDVPFLKELRLLTAEEEQ